MTAWTAQELASIDDADEIRVAGRRKDGSLRSFRIIWHVVVDGALYVRSVNGPDAAWYVGAKRRMAGAIQWHDEQRNVAYVDDPSRNDAVDEAYRRKYGNGSPTRRLNQDPARGTTLRIDPR